MPIDVLENGDAYTLSGARGEVISVTATTNASGVASFLNPYGGAGTIRVKLRKCGSPVRSLVSSSDPYCRVGLLRQTADHSKVAAIVRDPYWGEWISGPSWWTKQAGDWSTTLTLGTMYSLKLTENGVSQVGEWVDLIPSWITANDGIVSGPWAPAYPYASLAWDFVGGTWTRGASLGRFVTSTGGWARFYNPYNGHYEDIIVPCGFGAWGQRIGASMWPGAPTAEGRLSAVLGAWGQITKPLTAGGSTTMDVGTCKLMLTGIANAQVVCYWEGCFDRTNVTLDAAGVGSTIGIPPGRYVLAQYTGNVSKGTPRVGCTVSTAGESYVVALATSWTDVGTSVAGRVLKYDTSGLAGASIYGYMVPEPPATPYWSLLGTTDANGDFAVQPPGETLTIEHADWGDVQFNPGGGAYYVDVAMGARFGGLEMARQPGDGEGIGPWAYDGRHDNLPGWPGPYLRRKADGTIYSCQTPAGAWGLVTAGCPRASHMAAHAAPTQWEYELRDMDGTLLTSTVIHTHDEWPGWTKTQWYEKSSNGARLDTVMGGKVWGNVTAYHDSELSGVLAESERMGTEYGRLDDLYIRVRPKLSTATSNYIAQQFTAWQCPWCMGPLATSPDQAVTRGYCLNCGQDGRTYFAGPTVKPHTNWRMRFVQQRSKWDRSTSAAYWYRPEDYQENSTYEVNVSDFLRWTAQHLDFGTWNAGTWTDNEDIATIEASQARTIGSVRLKAVMQGDYGGAGCSFKVAAYRPDSVKETQVLSIPAGAATGDWYPINRNGPAYMPELVGGWNGETGYYTDVSSVVSLAAAGDAHFKLVGVSPAINNTAGVNISGAHAAPYLIDLNSEDERRNPDMTDRYIGQGSQHLVWRTASNEIMYSESRQGGYSWGVERSVTPTDSDFPAIIRDTEGRTYCAAVKGGTPSVVVIHRSRDNGQTWESQARSFVGQYPDLWRGYNDLQYLSVYSGAQQVIRRGWRGLSTVAGSAAIGSISAARIALVKEPHGALLAAAPSGSAIKLWRSRDDGATWSQQARSFGGTQVDLALAPDGIECAAVLSGSRQKFWRGVRSFSTLLSWPSAQAGGGSSIVGSGIIARTVDSERPATLLCSDRGNHFLCAVTRYNGVEVYGSRYAGLAWSRLS